MPLYSVDINLSIPVVIEAEDTDHAWEIAQADLREILSDTPLSSLISADVRGEITKTSQLPDDWDERCVPYGGDGNTRIGEILRRRIEGEV